MTLSPLTVGLQDVRPASLLLNQTTKDSYTYLPPSLGSVRHAHEKWSHKDRAHSARYSKYQALVIKRMAPGDMHSDLG